MRRLLGLLTAAIFFLSLHALPGCGSDSNPGPINLGPGDTRTEAQKEKEGDQMDRIKNARGKKAAPK
jgi:predicted small lipoprotein YifL